MKQYRSYFIAYAIFLACLFTAPHVYSFFDFHVSEPYEHYELERRDWEHQNPGEIAFMSYPEWLSKDAERSNDILDYIGDGIATSFDPWYEPQHHHNERGED